MPTTTHQSKTKTRLIVVGGSLLVIAAIMLIAVVLTFALPTPVPAPFDAVLKFCFYAFMPTGLLGGIAIVIGLILKKRV